VHRGLERALTPWIAVAGTTHPLGFAGLTLSLALAPRLGVRAAAIVTGVSAQGLEPAAGSEIRVTPFPMRLSRPSSGPSTRSRRRRSTWARSSMPRRRARSPAALRATRSRSCSIR